MVFTRDKNVSILVELNLILHLVLRNFQSSNLLYIICNLYTFSNGQTRYSLLLKQIFAYNMEGRSNPSGEVKFITCPDKPGSPKKPYIKGKIHAHRVKIGWGK